MDVGEDLVNRLVGYGIRYVFGYPGGQTLPLYNGIERRPGEIEHVLMHDERSGAYAADAYARATGTVGICDATVGPGATNLVSGLVEAYCSSVPVLAVVSDIPRHWEHRRHFGGASQGYEQRHFLEGCVKWYGRVETPHNLGAILHSCLRVATSGRPGPVVLELPDDVFAGDAEPNSEYTPSIEWARFPRLRAGADPDLVAQAIDLLQRCQKPIVVVGGGALHAGAYEEVLALVEELGCPVATTLSGKGIIPETHPLAVGVTGRFGIPMANSLLGEADCAIFIGSKVGQGVTLDWTLPDLKLPIIHIDIDPEELGKNYQGTVGVFADAKLGTRALVEAVRQRGIKSSWNGADISQRRDRWWNGAIEYKAAPVANVLKPQDLLQVMNSAMANSDTVVCDASLSSGWAAGRWQVKRSGRHFFAPRGLAGLGWGLPAAVGVATALHQENNPGRVICIAGDGGWGYSLAEVETAVRRRLPIISVVLNNSSLAWNKHSGENRYPGQKVFENFENVRYAAGAEGMGAKATTVDTIEDFETAFREALHDESGIPWVIEARSDAIETPVQSYTLSTTGLRSAY